MLLVVVWMRSYWQADSVRIWQGPNGRTCRLTIFDGHLEYNNTETSIGNGLEWRFAIHPDQAPIMREGNNWGLTIRPRQIVVPLWLLSVLATCCAVFPSVSWSRRFSLRTLLLAITLVAVVLGFARWAVSR